MRWIDAAEVRRWLSPLEAMAAIGSALTEHQAGRAGSAERFIDRSSPVALALMPGHYLGIMGLKAISLAASNPTRRMPTLQGLVVLFDQADGRLLGAVDAESLTAIRTAALAGFATNALAPPDASSMLLVGAGAQGFGQVEAVVAVRPIRQLMIWNRTVAKAHELADLVRAGYPGLTVDVATELSAAARDADVITLATAAAMPLLDRGDVKDRCHINAIGSYQPDRRELGSSLVAAAVVYADTVEGCMAEAGDLLIPIAEGRLSRAEVRPLATARFSPDHRLTLMKSVGSAVFDLACAHRLMAAIGSADSPAGALAGGHPSRL
ncbi:MAG TPA: hypothetical protein VMV23_09265 [Candidatus Nanopelagicaceae bacterium]|nr:hypothetical protein [Candidatus Nanopelagicaceae bacterium]